MATIVVDVATRPDEPVFDTSVVVINPDEELPALDDWLVLAASSEPVDLGVPAAALLDEARRQGEA